MNPTQQSSPAPVKGAPLIGVPSDKTLYRETFSFPIDEFNYGEDEHARVSRIGTMSLVPFNHVLEFPLSRAIPEEDMNQGVTVVGVEFIVYATANQPQIRSKGATTLVETHGVIRPHPGGHPQEMQLVTPGYVQTHGSVSENPETNYPIEITLVRKWVPYDDGDDQGGWPMAQVQPQDGQNTIGILGGGVINHPPSAQYRQNQLLDTVGDQQRQVLYTGMIDNTKGFVKFAVPLCSLRAIMNSADAVIDYLAKNPGADHVQNKDAPDVKTYATRGGYGLFLDISPVIGSTRRAVHMGEHPEIVNATQLRYSVSTTQVYYKGFSQSAVHQTTLKKDGNWEILKSTVLSSKESLWGGDYWPVPYTERLSSSMSYWNYPQAVALLRSGGAFTNMAVYKDYESVLREPGVYGKLGVQPITSLVPSKKEATKLISAYKKGHPKKKKVAGSKQRLKSLLHDLNA